MELPSVPHQPKSFDFTKRSFSLKEALARKSVKSEVFKLHGLIGGLGFIIRVMM